MSNWLRYVLAARKAVLKAMVPFVYGAAFRNRRESIPQDMQAPKRILVINGAHIGDIVIATSVIPVLRSAYPSAEIGFVTGSWARMVIKNHPELKYTHCVDHWRLNRSDKSTFQKMLQFRKTWRTALREIREVRYDVAISLYTVFPDLLDLSWAARIPVRIGFRQSFFSSLATHLVDEPPNILVHQGEKLAEALHALPIEPAHFKCRKSTLPPSSSSAIEEVCSLLHAASLRHAKYRVIHMGSAAACREFPLEFWRELSEKLSTQHTLLFTGQGSREAKNVASVIRGLENCIDGCGRLSWEGFVAAVRHAEVLYGVESMAGHVAGAVGTKCLVVYGGAAGVARWRPEGKDSIVFTNHVPCAPCLQPLGCADMTCTKGIRPDDLVQLGQ